ncbi:MAG: TIGR01440 family protein [Oscillospiraceae bacterium]|nr:TIGR01440 family protein [Oscillospiraceae bacterium]
MYDKIKIQGLTLFEELVETANLKKGSLIVLGCSTSEIMGSKIGTNSQFDCAQAFYSGFYPYLKKQGIFLAAQCCEHLGRALVVEEEYAEKHNLEIVNAIPQPKAGGSSATTAYKLFESPVLVEEVKADAGVDIGDTLIGMHLKKVAVPVRLSVEKIGNARVVCARTRPKFIGGERAIYNKELL